MNDHAADVRRALADPVSLCERLHLTDGAKRAGSELLIRCPVHAERNPSCSVRRGADGTVSVRCYACDWRGDALTLVAHMRGLDLQRDFTEVLAEAAELGGLLSLAADLRAGKPRPEYDPPPPPKPMPERPYPPADEVEQLWAGAGTCQDDRAVSAVLVARRIDPVAVDARKLGRSLKPTQPLPRWARYEGSPWIVTGHRLLLRVFDAAGELRSLRAWRIIKSSTPKRLPPAGHRASALVLANRAAVAMLRRKYRPREVFVVEGEPDFLTTATRRDERDPVIGIGSGSWTDDFAAKVPSGADVWLWTHSDRAGDKYAEHIAATLERRAVVWRAVA